MALNLITILYCITEPQVSLGMDCMYRTPDTGVIALAPHGSAGLALLLMGLSPLGLEDVVKLATPTIPPMARSPVSVSVVFIIK